MTSPVYFIPAKSRAGQSVPKKLRKLVAACDLPGRIPEGALTAVKVHWGEAGNTAYLRPAFARTLVDAIRDAGGRPFVTDTNVLYRGHRHDAYDNLRTAAGNGFTAESMGAPLLVADGLRGHDAVEVALPFSRYFEHAFIASALAQAEAMVVLSHVKGHMLFGLGGALKNLGMGSATAAGKHALHSDVKPRVEGSRCSSCRRCGAVCPADAIHYDAPAPGAPGVLDSGPTEGSPALVARIDEQACIGCGECVIICPDEAIPIQWNTAQTPLLEKTAEYAWASVATKRDHVVFVSALIDITPDCDCMGWSDLPIVPDIGYLASCDPVAIDLAAIDLVNKAQVAAGSALDGKQQSGDHFLDLHEHPYHRMFDYAEEIGLGHRAYELITLRG